MISNVQRVILAVVVLAVFAYAFRATASWIEHAAKAKPANTLVIGFIDDTPPFCFYSDDNQLVGINIDIARELGKRLNKHVKVESVSFNRLVSGLMTRQYDLAVIGSITPHRAKIIRYVQPHYTSADVLVVHPRLSSVHSVEVFEGRPWKIGVYNGTSYIKLLRDRGLAENMVIYPNQRDVFLAFYKRRVDAMIMNEDVATYIQGHLDPSMQILPEKIRTNRQYAFAVRKEDLSLWRNVNQAIASMHADHTFSRIRERWLGIQSREG